MVRDMFSYLLLIVTAVAVVIVGVVVQATEGYFSGGRNRYPEVNHHRCHGRVSKIWLSQRGRDFLLTLECDILGVAVQT